MPLEFSELFHKTALCSRTNLDVPGVYIWGFVYHKDENGIGGPVNFTGVGNPIADPAKHVFIPYYVGESSTSILSRLFDHIQPRKRDSSKKTRLTIDYIKDFFNDPNFPINSGLGNRNNGMSINASSFFSWIHCFFKLKACDFCDDVAGETADVAVGDAWLTPYDQDPLGNNILLVRNAEINAIVQTENFQPIAISDFIKSQISNA